MQKKMYRVIELRSGIKGVGRYDRIEALLVAHYLNKRNPKERYAICAV
jgi:hypothetical protein